MFYNEKQGIKIQTSLVQQVYISLKKMKLKQNLVYLIGSVQLSLTIRTKWAFEVVIPVILHFF